MKEDFMKQYRHANVWKINPFDNIFLNIVTRLFILPIVGYVTYDKKCTIDEAEEIEYLSGRKLGKGTLRNDESLKKIIQEGDKLYFRRTMYRMGGSGKFILVRNGKIIFTYTVVR